MLAGAGIAAPRADARRQDERAPLRAPMRCSRSRDGILRAIGAPADVGDEVARHLVRANLSGQDSHGVLRLPQYAGQAERGELVAGGAPAIVRQGDPIDRRWSMRSAASATTPRTFALDIVARKARHGMGSRAAIRHSTHVGRLGEFTERCQELGLVLLMTVGMAGPGVGGVVAHGGRERFFGANVWSIGVPGTTHSMVFDGSMSSIAVGKVLVAKAAGQALAPGLHRRSRRPAQHRSRRLLRGRRRGAARRRGRRRTRDSGSALPPRCWAASR